MSPDGPSERAASGEEVTALCRVFDLNHVTAEDALRRQLRGLKVRPGCACGCASVDLVPPADVPASTSGIQRIDADIRTEDGAPVGFVLVSVQAGRLDRLEFASVVDDPIGAVPGPEQLASDR
ncbi:MAG: hypothetical protein WCA46_16880 [Actinocatenispora sp.]